MPKLHSPVVTVGTFDGVHVGHRKILNRICELAKKQNGDAVLLTFDKHPRIVLKKDAHLLKLLNTLPEKAFVFRQNHPMFPKSIVRFIAKVTVLF